MGTGQHLNRRHFLAVTAGATAAAVAGCASDPPPVQAADRSRSLVSQWATDPWALGSYSALSPGTRWSAREVLSEAVIGGRLVLAGEYTALDFPATVNGAYGAGRRAARRIQSQVDGRSVIVIGAGIAGLAAAQRLQQVGWQVRVVEARDRVGGRIDTNRSTGVPLELGASWVHGVTGNPIATLARQAGLRLRKTDWDDAVVRSFTTGKPVKGVWAAGDDLWRAVARASESAPPARQSVAAALAAQGWRADTRKDRLAARTELVMEYGVDLNRLGAQALWEGDTPRGGDWLVVGGYGAIPEMLAQGLRVDRSTPVRSVEANDDGVRVTTDSGALRADAAILTVPVACLRAGTPRIALPGRVRAAIDGLTTGNLEKVFLTYDRAWWPTAHLLQVMKAPGQRWVEWYPMTAVVDRPVIMGLAGGRTATRGPRSAAGRARAAATTLEGAYR